LKNKRPNWCHLLLYFTSCVLNMFPTLIYPTSGCNTDTTPTQPHWNSNTHWTKNKMTNVVIQQNSRKLLMLDILISKTCWAHKKWNIIASDVKLVFYSSTNPGMFCCDLGRNRDFKDEGFVFISFLYEFHNLLSCYLSCYTVLQ